MNLSKPKKPPQPERKKIALVVLDHGNYGGVEIFIERYCNLLQPHPEFEPLVICSRQTPLYFKLVEMGIRVIGIYTPACFYSQMLRMFDGVTLAQTMMTLLREKPAVLHVQGGQVENLLYKYLLRLPVVYTFHSYGKSFNISLEPSKILRTIRKILRPIFTLTANGVDRMLFVSAAERNRLMDEGFLLNEQHGGVVHNGLPVKVIADQAAGVNVRQKKIALGIPLEAVCVSFICRTNFDKNPLAFVELADRLLTRSEKPLHFVVAGDGDQHEAMVEKIQQMGLSEHFSMLGFRQDVPEILAISTLVVSTSLQEGFGLRIVECFAAGVPCVTYAVGGICEILDFPAGEQLGVRAGDLDQLSEKCLLILNAAQDVYNHLSGQLRQRAMDFDESLFLAKMTNVYQSLLTQA